MKKTRAQIEAELADVRTRAILPETLQAKRDEILEGLAAVERSVIAHKGALQLLDELLRLKSAEE